MKNNKLSLEEVKKRLENIHGGYELLSEYNGRKNNVIVKHKKCGNIYTTKLDYIFSGHCCKYCASHRSFKLSQEEFEEKIKNSENGKEYQVLSEYKNTHTKVKFKHLTCGLEFEMRPNNFLIKGNRCPDCSSLSSNNVHFKGGKSKGENIIIHYLEKK